jgi:predicted glycosyltransferase
MRVWIDLANSPHVPLFEPVVAHLRGEGHHVLLTARNHAQTVGLARARWPEVVVDGRPSPRNRAMKALDVARRAEHLRLFARRERPDVALSHGSYSQLLVARATRIPAVTMMDYEHQPANHLSFRLARWIIVPDVFPERALRRFGAGGRVLRYPGFKEELYLAGFQPDAAVLRELSLDPRRVIAVFRPPPEGAMYHRVTNRRFDEVLQLVSADERVQTVLLPRTREQAQRYSVSAPSARIPDQAIDGSSLLALADLMIGAGGTMNRESAVLGTPTYTVFLGRLAAVDAELIRAGRMHDLRDSYTTPRLEPKPAVARPRDPQPGRVIMATIRQALDEVAP